MGLTGLLSPTVSPLQFMERNIIEARKTLGEKITVYSCQIRFKRVFSSIIVDSIVVPPSHLGRPLTLSEKILYGHFNDSSTRPVRGE